MPIYFERATANVENSNLDKSSALKCLHTLILVSGRSPIRLLSFRVQFEVVNSAHQPLIINPNELILKEWSIAFSFFFWSFCSFTVVFLIY